MLGFISSSSKSLDNYDLCPISARTAKVYGQTQFSIYEITDKDGDGHVCLVER